MPLVPLGAYPIAPWRLLVEDRRPLRSASEVVMFTQNHAQFVFSRHCSQFVNLMYGPWKIDPSEKKKTAAKLICLGKEQKVTDAFHFMHAGSRAVPRRLRP